MYRLFERNLTVDSERPKHEISQSKINFIWKTCKCNKDYSNVKRITVIKEPSAAIPVLCNSGICHIHLLHESGKFCFNSVDLLDLCDTGSELG